MVVAPTPVSSNCDTEATLIAGTSAANGNVVFSFAGVPMKVNGAYGDPASGTCVVGGDCNIGIDDWDNADISAVVNVTFATPAMATTRPPQCSAITSTP